MQSLIILLSLLLQFLFMMVDYFQVVGSTMVIGVEYEGIFQVRFCLRYPTYLK